MYFFSHAVFRNLTPLPDEKEFDVFLSYVWSPASEEVLGGEIISSRSPLNDEEGKPKQGFFFSPYYIFKKHKVTVSFVDRRPVYHRPT